MTKKRFDGLTERQQMCMVISVCIRNAMEDLHAESEWLTDERMAQLNPLIRAAVYEGLGLSASIIWALAIPDYWEIPESQCHEAAK